MGAVDTIGVALQSRCLGLFCYVAWQERLTAAYILPPAAQRRARLVVLLPTGLCN